MSDSKSKVSFVDDTRGVSEVVGFILVFAVLILALSTYQAAIVPQQNAQAEFQHFEDVRNEMIELRNSISTAGQTDVSQFPSVTLGTNYRTRTVTVNPPPPAGTLQTSKPYNITIANASGSQMNISTRFIEYQPGYREISIGSTWYEHSVLYLDERDRGGVSIIEEQNIVKDGTVRITALQNQFEKTGTGRVTLELYPQDKLSADDFPAAEGENLTVTIPTRLNEDEYWDDALGETGGIYQDVDPYPVSDDVYKLNLSVNESDLKVNTVGIREEPDEGPAKNIQPQGTGGGGGDSGGSVTDDGSLSFAGLPTVKTINNNPVTGVEFDFGVSNPDGVGVNYQIRLGVRNATGGSSNRLIPNADSPESVNESHGDALSYKFTGNDNTYLDVEIILLDSSGSVIDSRSGRITKSGGGNPVTLT